MRLPLKCLRMRWWARTRAISPATARSCSLPRLGEGEWELFVGGEVPLVEDGFPFGEVVEPSEDGFEHGEGVDAGAGDGDEDAGGGTG